MQYEGTIISNSTNKSSHMELIIGIPTSNSRSSADIYDGAQVVALQPNQEEKSRSKISLSNALYSAIPNLPEKEVKVQVATTNINGQVGTIDEVYLIPHAEGFNLSNTSGRGPRSFHNKKVHNELAMHFLKTEKDAGIAEEACLDAEVVLDLKNNEGEIILPWGIRITGAAVTSVTSIQDSTEEIGPMDLTEHLPFELNQEPSSEVV